MRDAAYANKVLSLEYIEFLQERICGILLPGREAQTDVTRQKEKGVCFIRIDNRNVTIGEVRSCPDLKLYSAYISSKCITSRFGTQIHSYEP